MNVSILESKKEEIENFIKEGKNYKEIADIYGVCKETVGRLARKYKFSRINHTYFDVIDNEKKAYLLGFFFADGSIYKGNYDTNYLFEIGLHKKDEYVLHWFKEELSNSSKIYYRNDSCKFVVGSKYLCESLFKYGLTFHKSHNINLNFNMNKIPKKLHRHFIRGFFDGDGHVGICKQKYTTKNNIYTEKLIANRFGFTSSNIKFLHYLKARFYKMGFNSRLYNRDMYTNNLHFSLNKKNINKIYNYFYNNSNYFLKRKKERFEIKLNNTELTSKIAKGLEVV